MSEPTKEALETADHLMDGPLFTLSQRTDVMQIGIARALDAFAAQRVAEARQQERERCISAARGEDANREAANEIAAAYIQGRLDAVSDILALKDSK